MKFFLGSIAVILSLLAGCSTTPITQKQQRVAVVIGNGTNYLTKYENRKEAKERFSPGDKFLSFSSFKKHPETKISGPEANADTIATILQKQGFTVYKFKNLEHSGIERALNTLNNVMGKGGIRLFFFSGHGYQINHINARSNDDSYLIPARFKPLKRPPPPEELEKLAEEELQQAQKRVKEFEEEFLKQTVSLSEILDTLNTKENEDNHMIVVLDSCRGEEESLGIQSVGRQIGQITETTSYGVEQTLTQLSPGFSSTQKVGIPSNFLLSFSTVPGQEAMGVSGELSDYVKLLVKYLPRADVSIYNVFDLVNKEARESAKELQTNSESGESPPQIATFLQGEDPEGFFKDTYLSGQLPIIAPATRP